MRKYRKLNMFCVVVAIFISITLTACGYTAEEKKQIAQYEKQGEINALNYIKEKYGFDATFVDVYCEKEDGAMFNFSPPPTGYVFVTLMYEEKTFCVSIAGDEVTSEGGVDNYQFEEIKADLKLTLNTLTDLSAEELFICYGKYDTATKDDKNGMISTYFNGKNLKEVLIEQQFPQAAVSYINQDVTSIDIDAFKEYTGIDCCLFVDYDSEEHYATINEPYYNISGCPINCGIDDNMIYINGYRKIDYGDDDIYVNYKKTEINGILLITEYADEQISLEKTTIDSASKWNGHGFTKAKQVFDAYDLDTESERVNVYVPVDKLTTNSTSQTALIVQYMHDGEWCYTSVNSRLTDDGKYIGGTICTKDYKNIKISVFADKK